MFQNMKALNEHKVDSEEATIVETKTKIVKQVSGCRPGGITRVKVEPKAVVLPAGNGCNDKDNEKHIE